MPSKYSHNVVLSEYSSQGIISLPNGQQLDYLKQASQSRTPSALTNRQRTPSIWTNYSDNRSVASRHVQSGLNTPHSGHLDLLSSRDHAPRKRLVIVESDSEDETSTPKPLQLLRCNSNASRRERTVPPSDLTQKSLIASREDANAAQVRARAKSQSHSESRKHQPLHITKQMTGKPLPERPRSQAGVKAFIQAQYDVELAAETEKFRELRKSLAAGKISSGVPVCRAITKIEQPCRQPRAAPEAGFGRGKGISLQEFLDSMPAPDLGHEADSEHSSEAPRPRLTKSSSCLSGISTSGPLPLHSQPKGSQVYAKMLENARREESDYEPNFEGFDDDDGGGGPSGGRSPVTVPAQTQVRRQISHKVAEDAKLPPRQIQNTTKISELQDDPPGARSDARETPANHGSVTRGEAMALRIANGKDSLPMVQMEAYSRLPSQHSTNSAVHSRTQSDAESMTFFRSSGSSTYGLSPFDQPATAAFKLSPNSRKKAIPGTPHSFGLPRIDSRSASTDEFGDMFVDINHKTTIFTSDEEDDDEDDLPTPRLQTTHGSVTKPGHHFGMISAGKDFTANNKDLDEMSDVSAAFPPDIGRYKYGGEAGSPLAMAMRGMTEVPETPTSSSFTAKMKPGKLRKQDSGGGGILGRLRRKKSGK